MKTNSNKFYNSFSFCYPLIDFFLLPQKRILLNEINLCEAGNLLEIGVGNGSHLSLYKKHKIIAIDSSLKMLNAARKHSVENIQLIEMDGEALQFENETFDYVVLSHIIAVAANPEKLLEEAFRVLKPTGKVFILNHFTASNWLRYIDRAFHLPAKLLHLKSVFYLSDISALKKPPLLKEKNVGCLSYFKILIYGKQ